MQVIVISWILSLGIVGINVYYLSRDFVDWLIPNHIPTVGKVFVGILVFPLMVIYILAIIYLTFREDTVFTYVEPPELDELDNGIAQMNDPGVSRRENLTQIYLPE